MSLIRKNDALFVGLALVLSVLTMASGIIAAPKLENIVLVTAAGSHEFQTEIAGTPEQRQLGLMYRQSLPKNHAMLFDYHAVGPISMWMKNTYIPLDMIFITSNGRVSSIAANTVPFSEKVISSNGAVRAVLEVNAGTAARIGLQPGDKVLHRLFSSKN